MCMHDFLDKGLYTAVSPVLIFTLINTQKQKALRPSSDISSGMQQSPCLQREISSDVG